jgi:dTDP-4-dehydrorhamnose 3,5-epimerase-like enzyme
MGFQSGAITLSEGCTMSLIKWINFQTLGDERGSLISIEQGKVVPFEIKRVYYIYRTAEGVSRGFHAHRNLRQVAICLAGKCRMVLDNGITREDVWLDCATKGILIEGGMWREMHDFSEHCILLVLASALYDESDYIRDYDEFLAVARER